MVERREHDRREVGSALAASLLIAMMIMGWMAVSFGASLNRRGVGRVMEERSQAFLIAESGIALAVFHIENTEEPLGEISEEIGNGVATIQMVHNGGGEYDLLSLGRVGETVRQRRARARKTLTPVPTYEFALAAGKKLEGKKATIDSFNSLDGTYEEQWEAKYGDDYEIDEKHNKDAKILNANATFGSNKEMKLEEARIGGRVMLPGLARIDDLEIKDDGEEIKGKGESYGPPPWADQKNKWKFEMKKTDHDDLELVEHDDKIIFPPILRSDLLAAEKDNDNDLAYRTDGEVVYKDKTDKKDPEAKYLEVKDGAEVIMPAGTYYLHELKVKKDGIIRVTGKVTIWVAKKFEIDDGMFINETGDPANLEIIVAGHDTDKELKDKEIEKLHDIFGDNIPEEELWKMKKGNVKFKHKMDAQFIGTIYAPTGKVTLEKGADVVGSIIADEIKIKDGAAFHWDESLADKAVTGMSVGTYVESRW